MGISRSLQQLARKLEKAADGLQSETDQSVRKIALRIDQVVVLATPVDTGRARSNWIVTSGVPTGAQLFNEQFDMSGQSAIAQGRGVILSHSIHQGPLIIQNNVEYIGKLEAGSSRQAPQGMLNQAIGAGIAVARKERVRLRLD